MMPVIMQDGRYLPQVTISKKDCRARPSTYSPAAFTKDRRGYRTPGPWRPDGTVGNTATSTSERRVSLESKVKSSLLRMREGDFLLPRFGDYVGGMLYGCRNRFLFVFCIDTSIGRPQDLVV